jgi:hypothetical protein
MGSSVTVTRGTPAAYAPGAPRMPVHSARSFGQEDRMQRVRNSTPEPKPPGVSSVASRFVDDYKRCCVSTQLLIVVSAVVLAIVAVKRYDGCDLYVLEPGLDDGFVCARLYTWWGLRSTRYELKRFYSDGYDHWHVRRAGKEKGEWSSLYGPDENGNLVMWFPK